MRIPTPVQRGAQVGSVTVDPLQPVFQTTQFANNQELPRNLGSLGETLGTTASILDKRRADLDTRAAQAQIDLAVREINDPNGGLLSRRGANARGAADEVDSIMSRVRGELNTDQLQGSSRQAVETLLTRTTENLYNRVAQFEIGQLEVYDTELTQARVAGAADMAAADPLNNETYQTGILQARDAGAMLAGKIEGAVEGDDLWEQTILEQTSTVVLARVGALASTSANSAAEFLDAAYEAGHIDATSYNATVAGLEPRRVEEDARIIAEEARRIAAGGTLVDPAAPIMGLITSRESGSGGYDALYGQAQNSDFAGVKISTMSISELLAFSEPSGEYGQWVKPRLDPNGYAAQNGLTSTPMGKYQIVGGTLRSLVEEMGLTGDEVFDEALQDQMFTVLMRRRLDGTASAAGKRQALRNEWEGFQSVGDRELDAAIAAFESGGGASYATPEDRLNAEQDPERRQLARQFYNADAAADRASDTRARAEAIDSFYATMDSMSSEDLQGTTWDIFLSQEERDILGSDVTQLRSWYIAKKAGEQVETDFTVVNDMMDNAAGINGPEAQRQFMESNLDLQRASMNDTIYNTMRDTQRVMKLADQDPDLPSIQDATPSMTQVGSMVDSKLQEAGFVPRNADAQAYRTQLARQVMVSLQQKALTRSGFEAWTDLDILNEIDLQSVKVTIDDGRGGMTDQTNVPLFQLGVDLGNENATADDLINAAAAGTVVVGGYVINGAGMAAAKERYLAENPAFEDVYAEDLIYYIYSELGQDPRALMGVRTLADQAEEAALAGGQARADAALAAQTEQAAALEAARRAVEEGTPLFAPN